jgi:hemolysin activation/secretion protein
VLALRFGIQSLGGEDLPVQVLLPVGGNNTLRGYPQDRFLGKTSAVFNAELRFPILWRIGGVVGFDAGKVWNSLGEIDLTRWATNPTIGLRLYMKHFLVRFDIGFGKNSTGMYFNFGHIF